MTFAYMIWIELTVIDCLLLLRSGTFGRAILLI
jgi:hypothetical protein